PPATPPLSCIQLLVILMLTGVVVLSPANMPLRIAFLTSMLSTVAFEQPRISSPMSPVLPPPLARLPSMVRFWMLNEVAVVEQPPGSCSAAEALFLNPDTPQPAPKI